MRFLKTGFAATVGPCHLPVHTLFVGPIKAFENDLVTVSHAGVIHSHERIVRFQLGLFGFASARRNEQVCRFQMQQLSKVVDGRFIFHRHFVGKLAVVGIGDMGDERRNFVKSIEHHDHRRSLAELGETRSKLKRLSV